MPVTGERWEFTILDVREEDRLSMAGATSYTPQDGYTFLVVDVRFRFLDAEEQFPDKGIRPKTSYRFGVQIRFGTELKDPEIILGVIEGEYGREKILKRIKLKKLVSD